MKLGGQWVLTEMKSRWWDLSPIQCSCNCSYSLITHNKTPVHSTWGLLRVCAACPTLRLNLSSELSPSWEQHPRYVPHRVRYGYNHNTNGNYPPRSKLLDETRALILERNFRRVWWGVVSHYSLPGYENVLHAGWWDANFSEEITASIFRVETPKTVVQCYMITHI